MELVLLSVGHLSFMTSPSMEYSNDLPAHWTPPTPYVVTTIPDYFGGRPTPPPSPFRPRDTPAFDDCTPCPPTPRFVPYDEVDGQESDTRDSKTPSKPTSPARPPNDWRAEFVHTMTFTDPLGPDTTGATFLPARSPNHWHIPTPVHSTTFMDPLKPDTTDAKRTSESTAGPLSDWLVSEPVHSTTFMDLLTNDTVHESDEQARDTHPPHVSDDLIYAFRIYARPCPVLMIIQRAILDQHGYREMPIDWSTCTEPFKLFSFTAGRTPKTGLDGHDQQTIKYYAKQPVPCPRPEYEFSLSYNYPISIIEALQQSLRTEWFLVYPSPIPVLIIRLRDLVGFYSLKRRLNGYAFTVSSRDSIWPIVRQCSVDSDFRPRDHSRTVETDICHKGVAAYKPQHIVAPKFAVNVFLETVSAPGQGPRCEYLGAYILQTLQMTLHRRVWEGLSPNDQLSVYLRVPHFLRDGVPCLPLVQFLYYKWDRQILGLADEIVQSRLFKTPFDHTDYNFDTDQDSDFE